MSKLRTPVGGVLTLSTDPWREAARDNNTLAMTAAARYLRSLGAGPLNLGVEQSFVELQVQRAASLLLRTKHAASILVD